MILTFVFLLFLSVAKVSLNAPTEDEDDFKTPTLEDDIAIPDILDRNADPCTAIGCKWPKSGLYVTVPYEIAPQYSSEEKEIIVSGLESFHNSTCIRFVPRGEFHQDYLYIFSGEGCWSSLGRKKGKQRLSLKRKGCLRPRTVQHEALHALGFNHEQVRSDRDRYVTIHLENVEPGKEHNFKKKATNNLGTPYDFKSVMEYKNNAFSKNGKPTIVAKSNPNLKFGDALKMSANDILRVKKLYNCYP